MGGARGVSEQCDGKGDVMGEAADDMLEGRACCVCGAWLDAYLTEEEPDGYGYPVPCPGCADDEEEV